MEDLNIILTFNPDHFREMYYQNEKSNILKYKPTQNAILYCILAALITFVVYLASFMRPDISWLIVFSTVILLFTVVYAIAVIAQHLKWKNSIEAFLKDIAQYKSHHLKITSAALELTQDSTITIEKWENIKSVQINETYIMPLKSDGAAFIFPAKSMNPEEFTKLKDFIIDIMMIPVKE
jgi:K+-sensing histidine kinase KdpD